MNKGAAAGPIQRQPPAATTTTTINIANCKKVFLQRDYSEGNGVRFQMRFPPELEGKIERTQFEFTVNMMNTMYAEAEKANFSTFCEGCMACATAYVTYFCVSHFISSVSRHTLVKWNEYHNNMQCFVRIYVVY